MRSLKADAIKRMNRDFDGAREMLFEGASSGHLDSQIGLGHLYLKEARSHARDAHIPPKKSNESINPILNAQKQALHWYKKAILNADCPEVRIDIHQHCANLHLELAAIYDTKSNNAKTELLKKSWHRFSQLMLDQAKNELELILGLDKKNARALSGLGIIYEQRGERDRAIKLLLEAYESDPTSQTTLESIITICTRYGEENETINETARREAPTAELMNKEKSLATKLIQINPECGDAWDILAACANANNNIRQAMKLWEKAIKYGSVNARINLANMYLIGRFSLSKKTPLEHSLVANSPTDDQEALEKAEKLYEQALEVNPRIAVVHHNLGLTKNMLGKDKEAVKYCQEASNLGSMQAHIHRIKYMVTGYGGYYNLKEVMWELIRIQEKALDSNNTDIMVETQPLLKLAKYGVANYLEDNAKHEITNLFPLVEGSITEKQLSATQQNIANWCNAHPELKQHRTSLITKSNNLLKKAQKEKKKTQKISLYNGAQEAFKKACTHELRLDELNRAVTELQSNIANADASIRTEMQLACGLLHFYQGHFDKDPEQYEQALKYLEQASSNQDIRSPYTARKMYFYASALFDCRLPVLSPIDKLTDPQKEILKKGIFLLKYITDEIAQVQPHHFFVGKAHRNLGKIQMQIYNNKKATREHYQAGANIGHTQCYAELVHGYQTGSLTDDGNPDLKEAKRLLEEGLEKCNPKDQWYQTLKSDLSHIDQLLHKSLTVTTF